MTLTLKLLCCLVCQADVATMRDKSHIDEEDEEGRRSASFFDYVLPKARYRDMIAPDVCDRCWAELRQEMLRRKIQHRSGYSIRFRPCHVWAWVTGKLEKEATALGREARRVTPHLAEKADLAFGIKRVGPRRDYGPRKFTYRRGVA